MRLVVDIDGTLCEKETPDRYCEAAPLREAIQTVNSWYAAGHTVILYTARHIDKMPVTYAWLEQHGVKFHHVCFGKPVGDLYIDDLCINCTEESWDAIRQRVAALSDRRG